MAERLAGIQVQEEAGSGQSIAEAPTAVTAFVGRCLRGPVNRPVRISGFNEFQRIFGGLWQPSTLSYADRAVLRERRPHGDRRARHERRALLHDPRCRRATEPLVLEALAPGHARVPARRRRLRRHRRQRGGLLQPRDPARAHAGLGAHRGPGDLPPRVDRPRMRRARSPRCSRSRSSRASRASCRSSVPTRRRATTRAGIAGYVFSGTDADDGAPLTDYDIIGSAAQGTGLFALDAADGFNLLCIPPLARDVDLGASTLLVANRFCRERRAILFVDPPRRLGQRGEGARRDAPLAAAVRLGLHVLSAPARLRQAARALRGLRALRRDCGHAVARVGALAGVDERLRRGRRACARACKPACAVDDEQRARLAAAGVNTVQTVRRPGREGPTTCTLAGPGAVDPPTGARSPPGASRCSSSTASSAARAGWCSSPTSPPTWRRAERQLRDFLGDARGARRVRGPRARATAGSWSATSASTASATASRASCNLMFGIPALRPGGFHAWLVSHRAGGSRVQTVSPNLAGPARHRPHAGARRARRAGRRRSSSRIRRRPASRSRSRRPASTRSAAQAGSTTVSPLARTSRLTPVAPGLPPASPKGAMRR